MLANLTVQMYGSARERETKIESVTSYSAIQDRCKNRPGLEGGMEGGGVCPCVPVQAMGPIIIILYPHMYPKRYQTVPFEIII